MAEQREEEMEEQEKVKSQAFQIINLFPNLPRLVVFDLDYTLWPFFCECYDEDDTPWLYPHARGILCALKDRGIELAIASRSPTSNIAKAFLSRLGIQSMFVAQEIYSSWTHKTEHFQRIHARTGIPFDSMLFFDDENRNIEAVLRLPVNSDQMGSLSLPLYVQLRLLQVLLPVIPVVAVRHPSATSVILFRPLRWYHPLLF